MLQYPGQYQANIIDYGISETKAGDPQAFVRFGVLIMPNGVTYERYFDEPATVHGVQIEEITWYGSFKEGQARDITLDTLVKMGFKGGPLAGLADGPASGLLDPNKVFGLSVKENTYNGKTSLKVSSVYIPGEGGIKKLSRADVSASLAALDGEIAGRVALANQANLNTQRQPQRPPQVQGNAPRF